MGKFSIRINPRYQKLYIVIAFFGIMLVAGLTAGFMTGKLVNPFSQAGEVCKTLTAPTCGGSVPTKCPTDYPINKGLINLNQECRSETSDMTYPVYARKCCRIEYSDQTAQEKCERQGGTWAKESHKCITPIPTRTPKPTITTTPRPAITYKNLCNQTSRTCNECCTNQCANEQDQERECFEACKDGCHTYDENKNELNKTPAPTQTSTPTSNTTTIQECQTDNDCWEKIKCDPRTENYTCQKRNGNSHCVCTAKPPTTSTQDDNNTPATGDTGETNTSTTTSDDSCDPTYKIPLKITGVSVDYHTCSNDVYTVKYTIKIHADNADKKECGGGHFTLTAIFPSTVQFDSGATQTSKPAGKPVDNTVTWVNRYVWDNSDQTYTLTAKIPKSQLTKETLTTTFKITLGDHTSDGGKLQTASSSNVGDCYTTGTTDAGGDDTSDDNNTGDDTNTTDDTTNTGDTTAGGDGTDPAYVPPSTGIIDEHPVFFISALAILAIIEHTFGIFTNLLIKLKKYVD